MLRPHPLPNPSGCARISVTESHFLITAEGEQNMKDFLTIARNLGHETPSAATRGNLKTDRDAEVYRDLYGHSRKMANISLRLKENKNVQLNHNRLLHYGANHVKIATK